jgi:hypothetical protein
LLNNCKKDFQFHTESRFFYSKYKIFFTWLIWISRFWALMTPGCISDPIKYTFWAQHKISDRWIGHTTYKKFMTNKFRFWVPKRFQMDFRPHKAEVGKSWVLSILHSRSTQMSTVTVGESSFFSYNFHWNSFLFATPIVFLSTDYKYFIYWVKSCRPLP